MNASAAKAAFGKMNMAVLPAELKSEFMEINKQTNGFTATGTEANIFYSNFADLYEIAAGAFPKALTKASKKSKVKTAAQKVVVSKSVRKKNANTNKPNRKLVKKVSSKEYINPKYIVKPQTAATPKVVKPPRVKAAPKPKSARNAKALKSKAEKAMEAKRARFDKMTKELKEYKDILRENDKVKMEIAKDAQRQYNKIVSLGKSKFEVDYEKLVIEHKLFKAFVATDKGKFKSIRVKAVGKVEPSLGKAKTPAKKKVKKATKKKAPKTESKNFFGRLFS